MEKSYKEAKVNIKKALDERGVSAYELAKRLGVEQSDVSKLLNKRKNPTLRTLNKIGKAIGCKVSDLIEQ